MSGSCLVPDFYVHPDYLLVDQVLDQIGKTIIDGWDSNWIKASKILHQIKVPDEQGYTKSVHGREIAYLTPSQEAAMHRILSYSAFPEEKQNGQTPPELLRFDEFLRKGYIGRFYSKHNFLNNLSSETISSIQDAISCSAAFLLGGTFNRASSCEIILGTLGFFEYDFDCKEERINLTNLLNLTKARNTLRNALVEEKLCSYVEQGEQYTKISSILWGNEKEWCRLLIEGFMARTVWVKDETFFLDPPEKKIVSAGRVLFKKSELKAFLENTLRALPCSDSQKDKEAWQKLFNPQKPYLKLLNELALSLPEETVETKFKKELVDIIEKKARSSGLDVSGRKLEHLATFLRSPEQEKGTAYRSKNKRPI